MMSGVVMLADDAENLWSGWNNPGSSAMELLIVVGAIGLMVFVAFIWAAFVRKPRRHRMHSYKGASSEEGGLPGRHKRRSVLARAFGKRRHRRRRGQGRERPVNPTLAQVGGLPQSRREQPPGS